MYLLVLEEGLHQGQPRRLILILHKLAQEAGQYVFLLDVYEQVDDVPGDRLYTKRSDTLDARVCLQSQQPLKQRLLLLLADLGEDPLELGDRHFGQLWLLDPNITLEVLKVEDEAGRRQHSHNLRRELDEGVLDAQKLVAVGWS